MQCDNSQVDTLKHYLADEIIKALGLKVTDWRQRVFRRLFHTPTDRFARIGTSFDRWVREGGFNLAARQILPNFIQRFDVSGAESIPSEGPLLIASNHPGTFDVLLIAAHLPRKDIKVVSSEIPFLANLPETNKHLIFANLNTHVRMRVMREALRHLGDGGALIIFPSGHIDPDPQALPGADAEVASWSRSVEILLRQVPETNLLVTIVSGMLARTCARSPITRLRQAPLDKRRLAEFLQVIQQLAFARDFSLNPKISFAEPLTLARLDQLGASQGILGTIIDRAIDLLHHHRQDPSRSFAF